MRVDFKGAIDKMFSFNSTDSQASKNNVENEAFDANAPIKISEEQIRNAIDSINEFIKIDYRQLKFVYHEELGEYYVQLIDVDTQEVVREIPPKKFLDAYYEMQKLMGILVDKKI